MPHLPNYAFLPPEQFTNKIYPIKIVDAIRQILFVNFSIGKESVSWLICSTYILKDELIKNRNMLSSLIKHSLKMWISLK